MGFFECPENPGHDQFANFCIDDRTTVVGADVALTVALHNDRAAADRPFSADRGGETLGGDYSSFKAAILCP